MVTGIVNKFLVPLDAGKLKKFSSLLVKTKLKEEIGFKTRMMYKIHSFFFILSCEIWSITDYFHEWKKILNKVILKHFEAVAFILSGKIDCLT